MYVMTINVTYLLTYLNTCVSFNEHFLQNYSVFNENTDYKQYLNAPPTFSMYLLPTIITEVERILSSFVSDSSGYDDIPPKLLKMSSSVISLPLTHIINQMLKTGLFPDQLKKASHSAIQIR